MYILNNIYWNVLIKDLANNYNNFSIPKVIFPADIRLIKVKVHAVGEEQGSLNLFTSAYTIVLSFGCIGVN